jgi:hypothetical protein
MQLFRAAGWLVVLVAVRPQRRARVFGIGTAIDLKIKKENRHHHVITLSSVVMSH